MKPYRDGGRFKLVSGKAYFGPDGVNFPESKIRDKEYVTVFGPCFAHPGRRYKLDDVGLRGAVTRLTCAREPDRPGLHEELRNKQFENYGNSPVFEDFSRWLVSILREDALEVAPDEWRLSWVHADHPKRELRIRTHIELYHDGRVTHPTWMSEVKYVCKSGEVLPGGKYLRATGDLGCPATAKAAYMMDKIKGAFSKKYRTTNGSSFQFVKKPERDGLISTFQDILSMREDMSMKCFSDDGIIGINTPQGRYMANTDISACDGSNFDPPFLYLKNIMLEAGFFAEDVRGVFEQCKAKCSIKSIRDTLDKLTRKRKIILKPKFYTLYSGSTLTTLINNCANFGIFAAVLDELPPFAERKIDEMSDLISRASFKVGYLVKCQRCYEPEDLQFLKISPTYVDGELDVFLNLGVMLRNLGVCKGDLPGRGEIKTRAELFYSDVVKSYVHAGDHIITDALRTKVLATKLDVGQRNRWYQEATSLKIEGPVRNRIPTSALAARYKVSEGELEYFADQIHDTSTGEIVVSKVLDAIFAADYGYGKLGEASAVVQSVVAL